MRPIGRLVLDRTVDNFFAETEQVAFCTQNIVPGHRLHQRPAAAGPQLLLPRHAAQAAREPNFTHSRSTRRSARSPTSSKTATWPCRTRSGRINYEPNSATGDERGPREDPASGFTSFPADDSGTKRRLRAETFADHYSQAGQFFRSQTAVEQQHIADAFTFELSKVENPAIRERMVANLRNVDEGLAAAIAAALGLAKMPAASKPAIEPDSRPRSVASAQHPCQSGRHVRREKARRARDRRRACSDLYVIARGGVKAERTTVEVIAPDDPRRHPRRRDPARAQQMVGGGPSVFTTRSPCSPPTQGAAVARAPNRPLATSSPMPTRTRSSWATTGRSLHCSPPPGSAGPTTATPTCRRVALRSDS